MPEAMAEDHIISWSLPGDLVFDPMAGAGSGLKMALLTAVVTWEWKFTAPYVRLAERRLALAWQKH